MAKSFGEAVSKRLPVVLNVGGEAKTEVWYKPGDEGKALELLEKMGVLKRVLYSSDCPKGCLEVKSE